VAGGGHYGFCSPACGPRYNQLLGVDQRLEGQKMAPKSQQIVFQNSLEILEYPN